MFFPLFLAPPVEASMTVFLHHVRPSKALRQLGIEGPAFPSNRLVATGDCPIRPDLIEKVDDAAGTIFLTGPRSELTQATKVLRLIDVKKRLFRLTLQVDSPLDHSTFNSEAVIANGATWNTSDTDTATKFQITPRIDDAGDVTIVMMSAWESGGLKSTFRVKLGSKLVVNPLPKNRPLNPQDAPRITLWIKPA